MGKFVNDYAGLCLFGRKGGLHPHGVNRNLFPELCSIGPERARMGRLSVPTTSIPRCCDLANSSLEQEIYHG